jgi:iron(III) transport system ATP-binding protein
MSAVTLKKIERAYGAVRVVKGVDLAVGEGEFVALLGPSGCGKTTTLRMIAGLEEPTGGQLWLGDALASDAARGLFVPPERRGLGMVFQSYAVWPHMSVLDNVAWPRKLAGEGRAPREAAAREALALVQLDALAARMPNQLSGGQQQRVALARALVNRPRVLLLDEPLSNLDAHLREELRREIALIRARLGVTVLYVTHDQEEALALADRIVIMKDGLIRQAGSPREVYAAPADAFVAGFIGKASALQVTCAASSGADLTLALADGQRLTLPRPPAPLAPGQAATLMLRPEAVTPFDGDLRATVEAVTWLGERLELAVRLSDQPLRLYAPLGREPAPGEVIAISIQHGHIFPS